MNHPGVYITILWLAILVGSINLIEELKDNKGQATGYVCPPCRCPMHDVILEEPGQCNACGMPLITAGRKGDKWLAAIFMKGSVNFYHHKIFYPVNFLALFIGFFALFRYRKELPTVLFLLFFLSMVLYCFAHQLHGTGYSMRAPRRWVLFPISFLLASGPALYLFITKSLEKTPLFSKKDGLHFLPAMLVFVVNLILFTGPESWRDAVIYNDYDHYPGLTELLTFLLSGPLYAFLTINLLKEQNHVSFEWQRYLIAFFGAIILIISLMVLGNLYYFDGMSTALDYHPAWLVMAVFTLWSTYYLVFKKEAIYQNVTRKDHRLAATYLEKLKTDLKKVMLTEKPYLNPDLNLQTLAQSIGVKEKDLSEVLNLGFSKSFYEYINSYRIEEVKKMLIDTDKKHLTNFAIAQEAGFNSKSAFFGLFKKHVGMTPGEFKKRQCK